MNMLRGESGAEGVLCGCKKGSNSLMQVDVIGLGTRGRWTVSNLRHGIFGTKILPDRLANSTINFDN